MKKVLSLHLFLLVSVFCFAQLGDLQLNKNEDRKFKTISADSTITETGIKNFLLGKNYRREWVQPVSAPVINLQTDFGGIKPKKEGGGKQTHSLHIETGDDREWVLRSAKKYFDKVIAPELKGTIAEKIVRDGVSASYPYSTLSIGTLAHAANVPYFPNALVFIPDDEALGEFREKYKNSLSFLELKTVNNDKGEKVKTLSTEELILKLFKSNDNTVDQRAVLRARLLDNFIMDFDRHEEQWEWVPKDSAGRTFYAPIPKDRDQAFFTDDGFFPKLLSHASTLGPIQGFSKKARNINTFNLTARAFDKAYLTELDEQVWSEETDKLLEAMTDSVIETALAKQPLEIRQYNWNKIIKTLKERRQYFKKEMIKYYHFLSTTVSIVGTNEPEQYSVIRNENGTVLVQVHSFDSTGTVSQIIYQRLFDPKITKELRLYGLEGNDKFLVKGDNSKIKIKFIGGPGKDSFVNDGKGKKIYVYDLLDDGNDVKGEMKDNISSDPLVNEYVRQEHRVNSSSPGIFVEYSADGGLFLGPSYTIVDKGFKKEPYSMRQYVSVARALNSNSLHLRYDADFIKITGKTDLLIRTDVKLPTVRTNFFGYGNNTFFDKSQEDTHYRVQYFSGDFSVMARNILTPWFQLKYGGILQYFKLSTERNKDKYITTVYPQGSNAEYLYTGLLYGGGEVSGEINTRNNDIIPARGVSANIYARALAGLTKSSSLTQAGGDISLYTDKLFKNHIILATAFGGGYNFGDFEFPQAQYLGFKQNLRGYRIQRFAGRARAYNNTEIRINFGDANFYLFKGPFGIFAFHDVGRVWVDNEVSSRWHSGYGGGIWVSPFSKLVLAASLAHSEEERALPMLTFGFQF